MNSREPSGDEADWFPGGEEAYQRCRLALTMFFERRGCRDPRDLADECCTRLWAKMRDGWKPAHAGQYLHGIARLRYLEYMREWGRRAAQLPEEIVDPLDSPGEETARTIARDVIASLSDEERELMEAHYVDGMEWDDLAGRTTLTAGGLRAKMCRLRKKLMETYAARLESLGLQHNRPAESDGSKRHEY